MSEEKIPTLSFGGVEPNQSEAEFTDIAALAEKQDLTAAADTLEVAEDKSLTLEALTPGEQEAVTTFVKQIDIKNSNLVLQYGGDAQTKISEFSDDILDKVRTKDTGEIGELLSGLVGEIKTIDNDSNKGGIFGWFGKAKTNTEKTIAKYDKVENNVDKIVSSLEAHKSKLLEDISTFDAMFATNVEYFKHLSLYIIAGQEKLKEMNETVLPELMKKAEAGGDQQAAQEVNDMLNLINRFEKKVHDLKLSRMVSLQMGPQIRLLQNNDSLLVEKIQSSILNTIPLWKSQMVIGLGLMNVNKAVEAQKAVTDITNRLLQQNSEMLKTGTVSVAKESERGIIDIETIRKTNADLIETIDSVVEIQREGNQKRLEAEKELARLEGELKSKLMELKK